jgi:hypothetical protein
MTTRLSKEEIKARKKKLVSFLSSNPKKNYNSAELGTLVGSTPIGVSKMLTSLVNQKLVSRTGKKGKYTYYVKPSQVATPPVPEDQEHEKGVFVVIHHGQSSHVFNDIAEACADAKLKATEADTEVVYVAQLRKSFQQVVAEEDIV